MSTPRTLIVGIGSPHGDDQAGWLFADRLAAEVDHEAVVVRKAATPAQLIDWLDGVDRLIVCDACRGLDRVGEVRSWTWPAGELNNMTWSGTHDLSLPAVLQLADRLGRLPRRVGIWSVEAESTGALTSVSSAVLGAVLRLIDEVAEALNLDKRCTNAHS